MNEAQRHRVGLRNLKIRAALWTPGVLTTDSSAAAFSNQPLLKITALVSVDQQTKLHIIPVFLLLFSILACCEGFRICCHGSSDLTASSRCSLKQRFTAVHCARVAGQSSDRSTRRPKSWSQLHPSPGGFSQLANANLCCMSWQLQRFRAYDTEFVYESQHTHKRTHKVTAHQITC